MSGPNAISVDKLSRLIGTPGAPVVLDVRTADDFKADMRLIPCSRKFSHEDMPGISAHVESQQCIVVCQGGAKLSHGVAALLRLRGVEATTLAGGFEAWRDAALPLVPVSQFAALQTASSTRWVTRHRPKIDRIACPWLIRRFVDPQAEFLFVAPDQVEAVGLRFAAIPFDMPEGQWTHRDDTCTFDTMLLEFGLRTPALLHLSDIVRAADTGRLTSAPEAAGLLAVSLGLSRLHSNDLVQLEAGMVVYDALYRWCRDATDETHSWNPGSKPAT